ncbi:MAG: hypothetical protein H0Z33_06400 [Bacillaceae bacterium]|nr:hypothetical protein [Bacillaceae bacterium]
MLKKAGYFIVSWVMYLLVYGIISGIGFGTRIYFGHVEIVIGTLLIVIPYIILGFITISFKKNGQISQPYKFAFMVSLIPMILERILLLWLGSREIGSYEFPELQTKAYDVVQDIFIFFTPAYVYAGFISVFITLLTVWFNEKLFK